MKYSQGFIGRLFVIRLEDGDRLPGIIEEFAAKHYIKRGICFFLGGIGEGSRIVSGPKDGKVMPPEPMLFQLHDVHEVVGIGTIFPNDAGTPVLHAHAAFGRKETTLTGCIRPGIDTWKVAEVILLEISGNCGTRTHDRETGFHLLDPES
ncbi:MAG: DNA-binding protein [Spirochaetales bacterium]|nr:DNA-binding protein [Spirochaetales bacterium]